MHFFSHFSEEISNLIKTSREFDGFTLKLASTDVESAHSAVIIDFPSFRWLFKLLNDAEDISDKETATKLNLKKVFLNKLEVAECEADCKINFY